MIATAGAHRKEPAASARGFVVYPAIDVRDGRVVRLAQGDFARETRYAEDPLALAGSHAAAGACWLHLVDLDATRAGRYTLSDLVTRIVGETGLLVQTGGGVRTAHAVEAMLAAGAARVVVGTLAVTHPATVVEWLARFGPEALCVAIDVRRDPHGSWCAATQGWTETDGGDALSLVAELARGGVRHLLSTDIARDGMLSGPALDWYAELGARVPMVQVQGSGGVGGLADVRALRSAGCSGAIIGRALLEGRLDLRDALGVLTRRIIPCLDVRDGRVVKGVRFCDHVDAGDIVGLAQRYRDEGADELVFYDITASPERRSVDLDWVGRVARMIDIPFCVAGGIDSVDAARAVLHAGADKVSVNSPALRRPALVAELAAAFGSQCVVIGIDSLRDTDGEWRVRRDSGSTRTIEALPLRTLDWIGQTQALGAGEIVLNCMAADGTRVGFDIGQLGAARAACGVPLIASGGAGSARHFRDAFHDADVDGALAASVFHDGTLRIPALKRELRAAGIAVRECA